MLSEAETKRLKIALLSAGLFLCAAVLPVWPYGFYILLRWIVCAATIYAVVLLRNDVALKAHLMPLAILATLFNPLLPVHLSRPLWILIDLGVAAYFLTLSKKI